VAYFLSHPVYTVEHRKKRSTPQKRCECEAQPQSETVANDSDMLLVRNGP